MQFHVGAIPSEQIIKKLIVISNNSFQKNYKFCIPEILNTNISHQLFDCKITFVNSQNKNKNSKGDLNSKNRFECSLLKFPGIQE